MLFRLEGTLRLRRFSRPVLWTGLGMFCCASVLLACLFGPARIPLPDVLNALLGGGPEPPASDAVRTIVRDLRLPRVLLSFCVGTGLSLAGTTFQGILRNPLADPFTLGVSSGAACGAALAISLGLAGAASGFGVPLSALAGASCALAVVLLLARSAAGLQRETLVLAGIVVSSFLAALIALIKALDESSVTGIVFWIMGSLQNRGWPELLLLAPGCLTGGGILLLARRQLDILQLGDATAGHLGLSVRRARLALLLAASLLTASCVAVSGIIGFIGLVTPHVCRLLLGAGHGRLLPAAALTGGLLLLWADVAAKTLLPGGVELPVGVITAMLGGPFFCYLLTRAPHRGPDMEKNKTFFPLAPSRPEPVPDDALLPADGKTPFFSRVTEVDDLGFCYEKNAPVVLEDIRLCLAPGTVTGLLGPNGSGKSTLLRCVSGALAPCRGSVRMDGRPVTDMSPRERALAMGVLPQRPETVPAVSAFALVLMGRYAHTRFLAGYSQQDRAIAWQSLAETGSAHLARRMAPTLSGGELQRVLLARALCQRTGLLLLDEATAGLDPAFQVSVLELVRARSRTRNLAVLAALHDLNLAALACDRLVFLKQGRVVAQGGVEETFTRAVLEHVYETPIHLVRHPRTGRPQVLPAFSGGCA